VQRKASTSTTLTLLAIHCNLYITDDVDTFVKRRFAQEFGYFVNFTVTSAGVRQTILEEKGVRGQKSLKTTELNVGSHPVPDFEYGQRIWTVFVLVVVCPL